MNLTAKRQQIKELLRLCNLTEAAPERQIIFQQLLGHIDQLRNSAYPSTGHVQTDY